MDINDLTIRQAKELSNLFGATVTNSNLGDSFIGKYVICRSRNEGVNSGFVAALDDTGVILDESRRLYYHKPASKNVSWYEGVAKEGLSNDSKVGAPVRKVIVENYSLTLCTDKSKESIMSAKDYEQN